MSFIKVAEEFAVIVLKGENKGFGDYLDLLKEENYSYSKKISTSKVGKNFLLNRYKWRSLRSCQKSSAKG